MYSPLPTNWDINVRNPAGYRGVADLYANPDDVFPVIADIPLEAFSVTVDRNSSIRRTAQITIVNKDLLDEVIRGGSSLEPYGSEIRLRIGFGADLIPVGVFQIEELNWTEDETTLVLQLFDRSKALERSSFGITYDASGQQCSDFITSTVEGLLPYVTATFDGPALGTIRFPGGTTYRSGLLQAVQDAAMITSGEFSFDVFGNAHVRAIPYINYLTYTSDYDWLVNTGSDGVLIKYQRQITRKDTPNKISVFGAPATKDTRQPYASAVDGHPGSPTYYGGRFGKVEQRIERQELTTDVQCQSFAETQLNNTLGLGRSLSFDSLVNPALDAGDKIRVVFPDGTIQLHLIDSLTFSTSGAMSIQTRVQHS